MCPLVVSAHRRLGVRNFSSKKSKTSRILTGKLRLGLSRQNTTSAIPDAKDAVHTTSILVRDMADFKLTLL